MNRLLLILLCLPMIGFGQLTMIPDPNFEQKLIDLGYDNVLDGSINTSSIDTVTNLNVTNSNISDLTGIEDFTAIMDLSCGFNQLSSLDVNQNIHLKEFNCQDNQLTMLDLSQNTALTTLDIADNYLVNIDLSQNTGIEFLFCHDNQLSTLNLSQNTSLIFFTCFENQLLNLDLRNGNNTIIIEPEISANPVLNCINVDDPIYSTTNWTNIDPQHYFSDNCGVTSLEELTTNKELLKVADLLGRESNNQNQPLIYFYNDGTVEKKVIIE